MGARNIGKYVWDMIHNRPLKIKNGVVHDEVAGTEFPYDEMKHLEGLSAPGSYGKIHNDRTLEKLGHPVVMKGL